MDTAIITNAGDREINEDHVCIVRNETGLLAVLADGLGGHGRGEAASLLVADVAKEIFQNGEYADSRELLSAVFRAAQKRLLQEQERMRAENEMKSTLVLCHITEETVSWGHIGDSRLYLFEKSRLVERTYDHSVPQMLVYAKKLKEKQIRFHEDRNRLLKVMGIEWNGDEFEIHPPVKRKKSQALLLCTDGFWEPIDEKEMRHCLKKARDAGEWLKMMESGITADRRGGSRDNYSAIGIYL